MIRLCLRCNKEITGKRVNSNPTYHRKFCSRDCRKAYFNEKRVSACYPGLSTATTGAINELIVAVDLMKRGYDVFRALSPSCSCDLAIVKDQALLRIEVKTGYRRKDGTVGKIGSLNRAKHNVKAVFIKNEKKIVYFPKLKKALKLAKKNVSFGSK